MDILLFSVYFFSFVSSAYKKTIEQPMVFLSYLLLSGVYKIFKRR